MSEEEQGPRDKRASATEDDSFEVKWEKKEQAGTTQTAEVASEATPETEVASLRRQLEEQKQRAGELRDKWQRAAADLANLRKRTEQERGEMEKFASMLLVQELLPVLDNFERALKTIPENLRMLTWIYGVALIDRELQAILERRGLAPIEAKGQPFNAQVHEAISETETADAEPGTVVEEFQTGYTMHGYVIRPSLVSVARAPAAATEKPAPAEQPIEPETADDGEEVEDVAETQTENVGP